MRRGPSFVDRRGGPPEDIPQRELRNDSARVLREVDAGKRFRITVAGRPVAGAAATHGLTLVTQDAGFSWYPDLDVLVV